jgi:proline iminopeptidase
LNPIARTATVDVNGVSLFTRSIGDGPVTVVLHGGPGAHHDYLLPQFDDLATGRELKYYDQRGGGRSPVEYDVDVGWERHVEDLAALLDLWNESPVNLLGYSWGGLLALLFALQYPDKLARLALVSPAPTTADGRREFERRFAERLASPAILELRTKLQTSGLKESDPEAFRKKAFELSVAGYFADPNRTADITPFRVTGRTQKAVWSGLGDYDLRGDLAKINVPSIVLHGAYDPIPIETAQDTADILGAELVTMPHSGHCPYIEDREAFGSALDQFLPSA